MKRHNVRHKQWIRYLYKYEGYSMGMGWFDEYLRDLKRYRTRKMRQQKIGRA